MKIAILKSVGSDGRYPIPLVLIKKFLAPFFQEKEWKVTDFAFIDGFASFIMLAGEGQADDIEGVLEEFLKHADRVVHMPETRDELFGIKIPLVYLLNITILAVLASSDQDANIFGGYVVGGLVRNSQCEVAELAEKARELSNKFKQF